MFSAWGVALNVTTASVQLRVLHNSVYLSVRLKSQGNNCMYETPDFIEQLIVIQCARNSVLLNLLIHHCVHECTGGPYPELFQPISYLSSQLFKGLLFLIVFSDQSLLRSIRWSSPVRFFYQNYFWKTVIMKIIFCLWFLYFRNQCCWIWSEIYYKR
jgi:hypothetical protein